MIKRTFKFSFKLLFEIIAAIIAGLLILIGAFIYRISEEPIKMTSLTPYVQDSLKTIYPDLMFNTNDATLSFEDGEFKVGFKNVSLSDSNSSLINIDNIKLSFNLFSLMQKIPSSIDVDGANVILNINEKGVFSLNLQDKNRDKKIQTSNQIHNSLTNERFSPLKQISFTNSSFSVIDNLSNNTWKFEDLDILFEKDIKGNILGETTLTIKDNVFDFKSIYDAENMQPILKLSFAELNLPELLELNNFENINTKVTGDIDVFLDRNFKLEIVKAYGNILEESNILLETLFNEKLDISGEFNLIYKDNIIKSKELNLNVGNISTSSDLKIELLENSKNINLNLSLKETPLSEAIKYWPKDLAENAKKWIVKHSSKTKVDGANVKAIINLDKEYNASLEKIYGGIEFSNADIKYLDTMPAIEKIKGRTTFNQEMFNIDIYEGNIRDVYIEEGSKIIIPLENTVIDINTNIKGNLKTIAEVINNKPLQYMDAMGISPKNVSGEAKGVLNLDIPIDGENIEVFVNTEVDNLAVNDLIFEQDLISSKGEIKVTNEKADIDLLGIFDKAKLKINWDEFFSSDSEYDRVAELEGDANISLLKELNVIDLTKSIKNRIPISGLYKSKSGDGSVFLKSNLIGADIDLKPIPYTKSPEEEANLNILINLSNNSFKEVDKIRFQGKNIDLSGWYFNNVLYLSNLLMPENNIDVSGYYKSKEGEVPNIDISGKIGGKAKLLIVPRDGVNTIDFFVEDLGSSLRSLEIFDKLNGGELILKGHSSAENLDLLNGRLSITNFHIVNMDALTTILGAMSLDGLSSALSGDGISFEKLSSDISWDNKKGEFSFSNGKTSGSSLGLTFDTIWDILNNTIAMKGTIAPLQGINNVIGSIPIIGHVLTGANQEGLFGAKYSIKGDLANPEIDVQGASSLTPGILRDIFFSGDSLEKTIKEENKKKEEKEEKEEFKELEKIRGVQ